MGYPSSWEFPIRMEGLVAGGNEHSDEGPGVTKCWNDVKYSTYSGDSSVPLNDMQDKKKGCGKNQG